MSRQELAQLFIVVLAGLAFVFAFGASDDADLEFLTGGYLVSSSGPSVPRASQPRETSTTPVADLENERG